jgi:hypothetical protein
MMGGMRFKLQYRLWHVFALTAAVGLLCAFPSIPFVVAGTSLVLLLAYTITLGFLLFCRIGLALIGNTTERFTKILMRRSRGTGTQD